MARARNIKPGFFRNEILAELDPLARLLFAGLWTIADRAGRLEDRPKRIKADVLPYDDDVDIDVLLNALGEKSFIARYKHGTARYIQILNFNRHQNPHKNEADSVIPPMDEGDDNTPDTPPNAGTGPAENPETTGKSGEHRTSTVQAPESHSTNRADSLNPLTDSGLLEGEGAGAPKPKARTKRATKVPTDFTLTEGRLAYAVEKGMDRRRAEYQFERLRNWAEANDITRKDWDAQWRNWVLKDVADNGKSASPDRPVEWRLNASGVMVEVPA